MGRCPVHFQIHLDIINTDTHISLLRTRARKHTHTRAHTHKHPTTQHMGTAQFVSTEPSRKTDSTNVANTVHQHRVQQNGPCSKGICHQDWIRACRECVRRVFNDCYGCTSVDMIQCSCVRSCSSGVAMVMQLRWQLPLQCCEWSPLSLLRTIDVRGAFDVLACVPLVQYDLGRSFLVWPCSLYLVLGKVSLQLSGLIARYTKHYSIIMIECWSKQRSFMVIALLTDW